MKGNEGFWVAGLNPVLKCLIESLYQEPNPVFLQGFAFFAITQQPWVFLLKMIILGCEMGVPPFKETRNPWDSSPLNPPTTLGNCFKDSYFITIFWDLLKNMSFITILLLYLFLSNHQSSKSNHQTHGWRNGGSTPTFQLRTQCE